MWRKTVRLLALILAILSVLNVPVIAAAPESAGVYRTGNSLGKETTISRKAGKEKTANKKKGNKLPKKSVTGKIDNTTEAEDGEYIFRDGDYMVTVKGSKAVTIPQVTVKNGRATATVKISDASRKILDAGGKLYNASKNSGGVVFYGVPVAPGRTVQMIAFSKKNSVKLSVTVTFVLRVVSEEKTGDQSPDGDVPPADAPAADVPTQETAATPRPEEDPPAAAARETERDDVGKENMTTPTEEPSAPKEPEKVIAEAPAAPGKTVETEPKPLPEKEEKSTAGPAVEPPEIEKEENREAGLCDSRQS